MFLMIETGRVLKKKLNLRLKIRLQNALILFERK